jgi:hypothetical protein
MDEIMGIMLVRPKNISKPEGVVEFNTEAGLCRFKPIQLIHLPVVVENHEELISGF